MKMPLLRTIGVAMMSSLICASIHAQEPTPSPADIDVEFEIEHRDGGKTTGSISHERNTKVLATAPLVNRFTGLDGRSHVVSISYVGYASFQVAKGAKKAKHEKGTKGEQLRPGHVFAVQVFSGEKGVTIENAETNVTKLVIYQQSPKTLYEDEGVAVIIRDKK